MQFFVRLDSFIQLLLSNITPRTHSVANDFDIEDCHVAQGGSEHQICTGAKKQNRSNEKLKNDSACLRGWLLIQ